MGARASREGAPRDDGALDDDGFVTVRATRRDATRAISHSHSFAFDAFRARVSRVSRARLTPRARRVAGGIARRRRARARRPRRRASRRGRRHRRARGRAAVLRRPRGRRDARARRRARRRGRRGRRARRERCGARRERPAIAPCERTNERTNERTKKRKNERTTRRGPHNDARARSVRRLRARRRAPVLRRGRREIVPAMRSNGARRANANAIFDTPPESGRGHFTRERRAARARARRGRARGRDFGDAYFVPPSRRVEEVDDARPRDRATTFVAEAFVTNA